MALFDDRGFDRSRFGYDRDLRDPGGRGYDRGYRTRWQVDNGDPFGDRAAGTPMRVIRGGRHGEGEPDARRERRYGRDYPANPLGYDPFYNRGDDRNRGWRGDERWSRDDDRDHGISRRGRGYDGGWF